MRSEIDTLTRSSSSAPINAPATLRATFWQEEAVGGGCGSTGIWANSLVLRGRCTNLHLAIFCLRRQMLPPA